MRLFCKTIATLALASTLHPSQAMALLKNDRLMLPIVEQVRQPNAVRWRGKTIRFLGEKVLDKKEIPDLAGSKLRVITDIAVHFLEEGNNGLFEAKKPICHGLREIDSASITISKNGTAYMVTHADADKGTWEIATNGKIKFIPNTGGN